ncbi:MAG: hypothetical protein NWF04_05800 [Candidatus Bathyarchaeota archaeon]|nr:hypothetical protein [Candidatus Bathyarchaeota archaeon]
MANTRDTASSKPTSNDAQVRLHKWADFKQAVAEKKPGSIVFILEQSGFATNKEVTILRVIMLHDKKYYIFIDTPRGDALRQTGIPLYKDKNGARYLDEDEVKSYLKKEFEKEKLEIFSFWTT